MNFKIDRDYTESAEKLLNNLYYHDYKFDSGIIKNSNCKDILDSHAELFDLSIITNLDKPKYNAADHERIRLFNIFASNLIQAYNASEIIDSLKNIIIDQSQKRENRNLSLFNLISKIKTESKRDNRKKLASKIKELTSELLPKLELLTEKRNRTSVDLGFKNYPDQISKLNEIAITETEDLCREFLADTEYIYKDLLAWNLKNKFDINLKDARYEDILFLFNSFELKEYFKQSSTLSLSTNFLSEFGMTFSSNVSFDLENRPTKNASSRNYPIQIPNKIFISIFRIKTIEDYEAILGQLGNSQFLNTVHIDESFENKRLIDPVILKLIESLFLNLVYQEKWLRRYLKIDPDRNFIEFLYLKKLFQQRTLCFKALSYRTVYENSIIDSLQEISDNFYRNHFIKPNEFQLLFDLLTTNCNPYINHRASILESYLEEFLVNQFDEQWWREEKAGKQILKWWNRRTELTKGFLEQELEITSISNSNLIRIFEKVF